MAEELNPSVSHQGSGEGHLPLPHLKIKHSVSLSTNEDALSETSDPISLTSLKSNNVSGSVIAELDSEHHLRPEPQPAT
jgi:hypothetical protein